VIIKKADKAGIWFSNSLGVEEWRVAAFSESEHPIKLNYQSLLMRLQFSLI